MIKTALFLTLIAAYAVTTFGLSVLLGAFIHYGNT